MPPASRGFGSNDSTGPRPKVGDQVATPAVAPDGPASVAALARNLLDPTDPYAERVPILAVFEAIDRQLVALRANARVEAGRRLADDEVARLVVELAQRLSSGDSPVGAHFLAAVVTTDAFG